MMNDLSLAPSPLSRSSDIDPRMLNLLKDWGWTEPVPGSVMQFCQQVFQFNPKNETLTGEIVRTMGYISSEKLEQAVQAAKATGEPIFSAMCRIDPALKSREAEVMAVKGQLAYYGRLPDGVGPHQVIEVEAVRAECEQLGCLPVSLPAGVVVMLFSSMDDMIRFRQRRWTPSASALVKALCEQNINKDDLRYGYTVRNEIAVPLREAKKDGESTAESGHSMGRLAYGDRTRGDERRIAIDLLENGVARKATDVSLKVLDTGEGEIHYRENSVRLHSYRITLRERIAVTNYLMSLSGANAGGTRLMSPKSGRVLYRGQTATFEMRCSFIPGDLRQAFDPDDQVVSISMRYLEQTSGDGFIDIAKLGFEEDVREHIVSALNVKRGILLLVGPTNSGKSTTLAAFLGQHYKMFGDTVKRLSLEDPKERTIIGVEQFSLPDARFYEEYLEGFLRHDPDVILLSEIRSRASAETATRAALTGHLVLSTFHASEPVEGFTSLSHLMSEERQHDLLSALVMIITQRLIPRLCHKCSEERSPEPAEWGKFRYSMSLRGIDADTLDIDKSKLRFAITTLNAPKGHRCDTCNSTGYVGVHPLHGILDFTKEVKGMLSRGLYDEAAAKQAFVLELQAIKALNAGIIDLAGASS